MDVCLHQSKQSYSREINCSQKNPTLFLLLQAQMKL